MNHTPAMVLPSKAANLRQLLRGQIAAGTLAPGAKLPTERELARQFGVSRITVRAALQALAADGLIERRRARGTFVVEAPNSVEAAAPIGVLMVSPDPEFEAGFHRVRRQSFFGEVAAAIEGTFRHTGRGVRFMRMQPDDTVMACLRRRRSAAESFGGLIFVMHQLTDNEIHWLFEQDLPAVSFGPPRGNEGISYVDIDNRNGAYQAIRHLLDLGRRRILLIDDFEVWHGRHRLEGYRRALNEYEIPFDESLLIHRNGYAPPEIDRVIGEVDQRLGTFDAVMATQQNFVFATIDHLRRAGLDVPRQVALVSYDESKAIAAHRNPAITAIRQPFYDLAEAAAELLLEQINSLTPVRLIKIIQPLLIVRESCGVRLGPVQLENP